MHDMHVSLLKLTSELKESSKKSQISVNHVKIPTPPKTSLSNTYIISVNHVKILYVHTRKGTHKSYLRKCIMYIKCSHGK